MDRREELYDTIQRLLAQANDPDNDVMSRIASCNAASGYFEAFTRSLVDEAHDEGATWDELGQMFGTTGANTKARFGAYRRYGGDTDE